MELLLLILAMVVVASTVLFDHIRRTEIRILLRKIDVERVDRSADDMRHAFGHFFHSAHSEIRSRLVGQLDVRTLRDWGASGARFSALESSGVHKIAEIPLGDELEKFPGVGPHTAALVREAVESILANYEYSLGDVTGSLRADLEETTYRYNKFQSLLGDYSPLRDAVIAIRSDLQKRSRFFMSAEEIEALRLDCEQAAKVFAPKLNEVSAALSKLLDRQQFLATDLEVQTALKANTLIKFRQLNVDESTQKEGTEKHFEDNHVVPWLESSGIRFERQHRLSMKFGSSKRTVFVDFVLRDASGAIATLIESKRRLVSEKEIDDALAQAKSYALELKIRRFILASPEGLWIVSWSVEEHRILRTYSPNEVAAATSEIKLLVGL